MKRRKICCHNCVIEKHVHCGIKQFQEDCRVRYVILLYKTNQFHGTLLDRIENRGIQQGRMQEKKRMR